MSTSASPPPAEPAGPRVLVVDTASRMEGLALACGSWTVSVRCRRTRKGHSAILLPTIEAELQRLGWSPDQLDGFGVVIGPGSFTGIRVGIATIDGLARAAGKPAFGFGSLAVRAMALPWTAAPVVPILDARMGEVYGAAFLEGKTLVEPCAMAPADFAAHLTRELPEGPLLVTGGGARLYAEQLTAAWGERMTLVAGAGDHPGVAAMAVDVVERLERGEVPGDGALDPIYLRPSQAEVRP